MGVGPFAVLVALAAAAPQGADDAKPRLFVSTLSAQGVEPEQARAFTDAVVATLSSRQLFEVVSTKDLETILGAERQKQLLGICENDPGACAQGSADAVTARFVLSGQLSKLGTAYQLSLQMVDTQKNQPVARALRLSNDIEALRALVPYVAAEATGSPLPPPPSKALAITLVSAGAAAFLAGAVFGMLALSRQAVMNDELCPDGNRDFQRCTGVSLRPREFYLAQDRDIGMQKSIALGLLLGGATLGVLGIILWPASDSAAAARVAILPSFNGFAVAGAF